MKSLKTRREFVSLLNQMSAKDVGRVVGVTPETARRWVDQNKNDSLEKRFHEREALAAKLKSAVAECRTFGLACEKIGMNVDTAKYLAKKFRIKVKDGRKSREALPRNEIWKPFVILSRIKMYPEKSYASIGKDNSVSREYVSQIACMGQKTGLL